MMSTETASRTPITELWSRVLHDPRFDDLPYKVETNEHGQLILTPAKNPHSFRQVEVVRLLIAHTTGGRIATEFAIVTSRGVKVPDVIWVSDQRYLSIKGTDVTETAPEVLIEVLSPSNSAAEILVKRHLYFEAGALEFWTCDVDGRVRFYDSEGELSASALVPSFPPKID